MELHNGTEILPTVAIEMRQGTESHNTYTYPIVDTFGHYIWKATVPEQAKVEHQIWNLKCEESASIDQRSCPFPVAYAALAHPITSAVQISITCSTMHSHTDSVFIITHASGSTSVGNTVYSVADNISTLGTCL